MRSAPTPRAMKAPAGSLRRVLRLLCGFALASSAAAQQLPPVASTRPVEPATRPAASQPSESLRHVEPATKPVAAPPVDAAADEAKETWLEVTTDHVNLRAMSGDTNSVRVGQANAGAFLWAVSKRGNWWSVVPPSGVYSVVEASLVTRDGDHGTIKGSNVNVRPADMNEAADPLIGYPQTKLDNGDVVTIVGERTSTNKQTGEARTWYVIVPPKGVRVNITGEFVREVTEAYAAEHGAKKPDGQAPVVAKDGEKPADGGKPADAARPDADSWLKKLKLAEGAIDAENRKPNERQDWAPILALLRPIADQDADPHAAAAASQWIDRLNELVEAVAQASTQPAGDKPSVEINNERIGFDAEGILKPSVKVPAGEFGLRFGLFKPGTHYVTAYVEFPRDLKFNAVESVGRYVGIQGVKYKEGKVDIYRVTKVTVSQAPQPRQP